MITERPLSCAYPAMVASPPVTPSVASIIIRATSARFQMLARHDDGQLLGHQLGLALAADAGGIDEAIALAFVLHQFVNRIARGAGNGRDDGARGPVSAFNKVDLPTLGRPMMATLVSGQVRRLAGSVCSALRSVSGASVSDQRRTSALLPAVARLSCGRAWRGIRLKT